MQTKLEPEKTSPRSFDLPELTSCRCFAAVCVVISHLHALGFISAASVHRALDGGRPAVSFFFVLSGFILDHNYDFSQSHSRSEFRYYGLARFARLYPTVIVALLLAAPAGLQLWNTNDDAGLLKLYALKDHYFLLLTLSGIAQLFVVTGWLPFASFNQPWNGPAWSLSCEFFFYVLFPFVQPIIRNRTTAALLVASICGWALQGLWIASIHFLVPVNRGPFLISQFPITHLFEFLIGIVVGTLSARIHQRTSAFWLYSVLLMLAVFACVAPATTSVLEFLPRYYSQTPIYALLITVLARNSGALWLGPLRQPLLQRLGHSSYALYMIHIPVLTLALVFGGASVLGWFWLPLLLSLGYIFHYFLSEPLTRSIVRTRNAHRSSNAAELGYGH